MARLKLPPSPDANITTDIGVRLKATIAEILPVDKHPGILPELMKLDQVRADIRKTRLDIDKYLKTRDSGSLDQPAVDFLTSGIVPETPFKGLETLYSRLSMLENALPIAEGQVQSKKADIEYQISKDPELRALHAECIEELKSEFIRFTKLLQILVDSGAILAGKGYPLFSHLIQLPFWIMGVGIGYEISRGTRFKMSIDSFDSMISSFTKKR